MGRKNGLGLGSRRRYRLPIHTAVCNISRVEPHRKYLLQGAHITQYFTWLHDTCIVGATPASAALPEALES